MPHLTADGLPIIEVTGKTGQELRSLLKGKHSSGRLLRKDMPPKLVEELDRLACSVFGKKDCTVNYYMGCNSCCADEISSSIADTTCGRFCHKVCGRDPCA